MGYEINGKVKKVHGTGNPSHYIIEDDEGNEYIAHVGDIKENEAELYKLENKGKVTMLKEGESVTFEISSDNKYQHVFHVKKQNGE